MNKLQSLVGVSNGPLKLSSARKIWPLLDLLMHVSNSCRIRLYEKLSDIHWTSVDFSQ